MTGVPWDWLVLGTLVAVALSAAWFSGRLPEDEEAFLLADRLVPPSLSAAALTAVDATALTVVALPALSFAGDLSAFPFLVGAAAARIWGAFAFAPALYSAKGSSVYSLLEQVFGPRTRKSGASVFVISRLAASGVRLAAGAAALSALFAGPMWAWTAALALLGLALALPRGLEGVLWSDVVQCLVLLSAALVILLACVRFADGGFSSLVSEASQGGRLTLAHWHWGRGFFRLLWRSPDVALGSFCTGFIASAAAFGADHESAQKLMAAASEEKASLALLGSAAGTFLLSGLFLLCGAALYGLYRLTPAFSLPERPDDIVAHFASTVLPAGLKGLVAAAVALASADLPLTALAACALDDLGVAGGRRGLSAARSLCVAAAALVAVWAILCALRGSRASFEISAIGFGALLGLMLAGVFTSAGTDRGALALGLALLLAGALGAASHAGAIRLSWTWLGPLAAVAAFAFASPYGLG